MLVIFVFITCFAETKNDADAGPRQRSRGAQSVRRSAAQERIEYPESDPVDRNAAENLSELAEPDASLVGPTDGAQKERRHTAPVAGGRSAAVAFPQQFHVIARPSTLPSYTLNP